MQIVYIFYNALSTNHQTNIFAHKYVALYRTLDVHLRYIQPYNNRRLLVLRIRHVALSILFTEHFRVKSAKSFVRERANS